MLPTQSNQNYSQTLEELGFIFHDGRYWLSQTELGRRLGFSHPREAMNMLFARNKDELKSLTKKFKCPKLGFYQKTRFYDQYGCLMAAFLCKTTAAKKFRQLLFNEIMSQQVMVQAFYFMEKPWAMRWFLLKLKIKMLVLKVHHKILKFKMSILKNKGFFDSVTQLTKSKTQK